MPDTIFVLHVILTNALHHLIIVNLTRFCNEEKFFNVLNAFLSQTLSFSNVKLVDSATALFSLRDHLPLQLLTTILPAKHTPTKNNPAMIIRTTEIPMNELLRLVTFIVALS